MNNNFYMTKLPNPAEKACEIRQLLNKIYRRGCYNSNT